MKDNITLWEEKNSTDQQKNLLTKEENVNCCIITETKKDLTKNEWKDTGKVSGIYKIINKVNGKYYVGSTNYFWNRRRQHQMMLSENRHTNPHLQSSWNKYGEENFIFQVIEKVPIDKLILIEQQYLDIAKTEQDKCYNQNWIAGRQIFTPEIRKKISDSKIGKPLSEKHKSSIRMATKKVMGEMRERFIDTNIHTFFNRLTKEKFEGTSFHFRKKYNLSVYGVRRLVRGIRKRVGHKKEWKLLTPTTNKHH